VPALGRHGRLVLLGSAVVALLLHGAAYLFPDTWGGPNILHGLLLLGAYVGVGIGLLLVLIGAAKRRRHGTSDSS